MAINGQNARSGLANAYGTGAPFAAITTTVPGASAGTEPTGGSPAYARKATTWGGAGATNTNAMSAVTFDVPSGANIQGAEFMSALTAGTYWDGAGVTAQAFSSQGQYVLSASYTQT